MGCKFFTLRNSTESTTNAEQKSVTAASYVHDTKIPILPDLTHDANHSHADKHVNKHDDGNENGDDHDIHVDTSFVQFVDGYIDSLYLSTKIIPKQLIKLLLQQIE